MWSDNETNVDLLGFEHLVAAVASIVDNDNLLPATIGVYGDWGSGKSSLLQMIVDRYKDEDGVLLLAFNGWLFEGFDDAKTALMGTILDEIISRRLITAKATEAAKRLGWRLLKQIDVMRAMGVVGRTAVAGLTGGLPGALRSLGKDAVAGAKALTEKAESASVTVEQIANEFKTVSEEGARRGVREFRRDFAELLAQSDIKKLVVVIDDLDRCLPETIIETLEAIKLFLFVPRTAFILGADERLVKYAVRRRFPELPGQLVEVGSDYLEKLIQYPVYVPPLGRGEMETYISLLFASVSGMGADDFKKTREHAVKRDPKALLDVRFNIEVARTILSDRTPPTLGESLATAHRIAAVLASESGNPRQGKRFLNTLMLRLAMANSRGIQLKERVLAKLMLLERFRPESFRSLAEAQARQSGHPKEIATAERLLLEASAAASKQEAGDDSDAGTSPARGKKGTRTTTDTASGDGKDARGGLPLWLGEEWVQEWVRSEPALATIDLQPYFFFSRDKIGAMASATQRLSARGQEVLAKLLSESEASKRIGLQDLAKVSGGDAAGILEALSERARTEEDVDDEDSVLFLLLRLANARPDMFGQVIALLNNLPDTKIPFTVPLKLIEIAGSQADRKTSVEALLKRWETTGTNPQLRGGATAALKRLV